MPIEEHITPYSAVFYSYNGQYLKYFIMGKMGRFDTSLYLASISTLGVVNIDFSSSRFSAIVKVNKMCFEGIDGI